MSVQSAPICVNVPSSRHPSRLVLAAVHNEDLVPRLHELRYQSSSDESGSA